ncbi:MAG: type II CRISPR RNA-guided endonuclease Cas9, partial [Methyloprofundus sp.]|nr:type II CRISPR RNA-guided endonuclease Cas9 [Methyloprofundus sp.]
MSSEYKYRLGLDIGIASVGAALLTDDKILALHVRTFEKAESAQKGESLNKIRREARLARRRIRRRAFRLTRLRRALHRAGLIDTPEIESINIIGNSPWSLRAKGLDKQLAPRELAYVLYHIIKHRGFQSNRKSEAKQDEKAGQMLSGVAKNQVLLEQNNYRTIGEMVAKDEHFIQAKRNKGGDYSHTFARQDLVDEVETLFNAQQGFNNASATDELKSQVINLLLARKPALSGEALLEMVGKCTFETAEYRAPKACYSVERFTWLTKLNNLRLLTSGDTRALTEAERQLVLELPFNQAKLTYKQVRKKLDLPEDTKFNGLSYFRKNGTDPESSTLFEAKHFNQLKKAYKEAGLEQQWLIDIQNPHKLDNLAYAQTVFKDDADSQAWLLEKGIEPNVIEAVLAVSFSEFIRLSLKALYEILPSMEQGQRYDQAVELAGYQPHSRLATAQKTNYLPAVDKEDFTNPVVYRAINQTRKLVNAIVKKYGSPMSVHIELARDLNKSKKERDKIADDQKENEANRKQELAYFVEQFGKEPNGYELAKMRLYREQKGQCAYSQKAIDLDRLCEVGYVEIDHALPYSRSFDNSFNNKVLVHIAENRNKGNRTPYEYLGGQDNHQAWLQYEAWVKSNIKNIRKQQKLLRKDFNETKAAEFRERNLSDTRYAGRVMKNLIEDHLQLAEESTAQRCVVVSGQLTAFLRGKWGLNKVRADGDKHHALDAAVVAACSHSMVKRLSDYARKQELEMVKRDFVDPETGEVLDIARVRQLEAQFPTPWPHFRKELLAKLSDDPKTALAEMPEIDPETIAHVQPIRVSRMPTRRSLGAAHQDTVRSAKLLDQKLSSVKTSLSKIKLKDLERIQGYEDPRNQTLMEALRKRLNAFSDNAEKAFAEPFYKPCKANGFDADIAKLENFEGEPAPQVKTLRLLDTQKSGIALRDGIANNGDMVRIDIFTHKEKYFVVPIYVADTVKPKLPNLAVVAGKNESEWIVIDESYEFLFSVYPNDWLKITFKSKPSIEGYYAGLDRSTGAVHLWTHDRNQSVGKDGLVRSIGIKSAEKLEKYHIDLLGQAYRAQPETRK